MRRAAWMSLAAIGCGGQSGENPFNPCAGATYTDVADDDASLGFTATDVIDALTPYTGVQWEISEAGSSDTLSMTGLALAGDVQTVDLSDILPGCALDGPALRFWMSVDVDLGDGDVLASGAFPMWATGTDPASIRPDVVTYDEALEATLDGPYADAFDAWWQARQDDWPDAKDFEVEGIHLVFHGTWDALEVDIDALTSSSEWKSASVLWRGPATP